MVSKSTLYISNLPTRPKNKQNFIKSLLKHFNPNNEFSNISSVLPDQRFDINPTTTLLDESLGIVSVSRSQSAALKNKCFITFNNDSTALEFKKKFQHMKVMGKCISITNAKRDSYMSMAKANPKLLGKVLKTKQLKTIQSIEDPLNLKRKLRRLRSKLRSKGELSQDEINTVVQAYKIKIVQKSVESGVSKASGKAGKKQSESKFKSKSKPKPKTLDKVSSVVASSSTETKTTKKANVFENPPNKTLLVQDLPNDMDEQTLTSIFNFDGFNEVRMVSVRQLAFVEYDSIENAKNALNILGSSHTLPDQDKQILIGFAK
ncbi:U1 small nuclear ribonucleoprotein A [Monosporozyma servazzii]